MPIREQHIDMAAGIMIMWMILGHVASHANYNGAFFKMGTYLSFFMPWFFYKAGMFYQNKHDSIRDRANRGGQKLLKPFVIFSLIGQTFYYICLILEHNVSFRSFVYQPLRCLFVTECLPGNGALWFLIVLFMINIFAPYIIDKLHPIVVVIVGIGIAFLCYLLHVSWFPCIIPNFFAGMAFFIFGYWFKDKEHKWFVFATAVLVYALCCIIGYPSVYFHHNTASDSFTYLLYFPASVAGIIILNNLCHWISPYFKYSLFRWIGQNAMNLYVTHWIVLVLLRLVVLDVCQLQNTTLIFWIYVGTMVLTLPLLNKLINHIKQVQIKS